VGHAGFVVHVGPNELVAQETLATGCKRVHVRVSPGSLDRERGQPQTIVDEAVARVAPLVERWG
jgi:hypothetical protein